MLRAWNGSRLAPLCKRPNRQNIDKGMFVVIPRLPLTEPLKFGTGLTAWSLNISNSPFTREAPLTRVGQLSVRYEEELRVACMDNDR